MSLCSGFSALTRACTRLRRLSLMSGTSSSSELDPSRSTLQDVLGELAGMPCLEEVSHHRPFVSRLQCPLCPRPCTAPHVGCAGWPAVAGGGWAIVASNGSGATPQSFV